uniref:Uncharacterized protein n=1 Tax=Salix viminalis TaxID=40686 RepID=A0A6N2NAZ5_SALVM
MLTDVDGALDTLALVTSLDYLSPLLLEPIPIQGQDQVRHRHKKKSYDKIILAMINGEAEEGGRDGRRARRGFWVLYRAKQDVPLVLGGDIRERLNAEKALINCQNDQVLVVPQEKKIGLCEICDSFLVANDVGERTQSQFSEKQMNGRLSAWSRGFEIENGKIERVPLALDESVT